MQPKQFPKQQPPREAWRIEIVDQQSVGGLVLFEYAIREPLKDPFLLNNHRAQIRTDHQRIATGPNGGRMHVSGVEVFDIASFETGPEFYRWQDKDRLGRWRDDRGRVLPPFVFPTAPWAGGVREELDPQWVREKFTLSVESQIADCLSRYQERAEERGYVGDKRGTTLNLQVGAGAADGVWWTTNYSNNATYALFLGYTNLDAYSFQRFTNVTIPSGATVNTATLTFRADSSQSSTTVNVGVTAVDEDDATAPTSRADGLARAQTAADVAWSGLPSWTSGVDYTGPNIASVVQEVVDRAGWASGNALCTLHRGAAGGSSNARREAKNYDQSSTFAAKLDIDYTAGGGADPEGRLKGGKLIRGGLLRGGVL